MLLEMLLSKDVGHFSMRESIQNDLHRLLNAKQGSLSHMPNYGLPDLQWLYHSFPNGVSDFIDKVRNTIERYEPRLSNVKVTNVNKEKKNCVISLSIRAEIKNQGQAIFDGDFYSAGHVNLHLA